LKSKAPLHLKIYIYIYISIISSSGNDGYIVFACVSTVTDKAAKSLLSELVNLLERRGK